MTSPTEGAECSERERQLLREVTKLKKINNSLMGRIERDMDMQGSAFSLFQAASALEKKVEERTSALGSVLRELRCSNRDLTLARDKAEAAARAKDEFLAGMSHELRTPLNAVLGLSEALQDQVYGTLNGKQNECLATIESSGRHLLSLISDILDIARVGAGELQIHPEAVKLEKICKRSLEMVRRQAEEKGLHLKFGFASELGLLVTDSKRLTQVLVNLLANAVKFTPDGGTVSLDVQGSVDGRHLEMSVEDTGIGISKDDLHRVFEPFVQVDSRLARRYDGSGLGLALVKQLVAVLGGEVRVVSELGAGSRFTVSLPCQETDKQEPADDSARSPTAGVEPRLGSKLVLLAEDNQANRLTIGDYLLAKGYRVAFASNGEEAVQQVKNLRPDIVLMDVQMPHMDGLEATTAIRREQEFEQLPIVALTALAMADDSKRCRDAGATDYLSKPVRLKALIEVIEGQFERDSVPQ